MDIREVNDEDTLVYYWDLSEFRLAMTRYDQLAKEETSMDGSRIIILVYQIQISKNMNTADLLG